MNSILIVTGSLPPDVCGVGDYTRLLLDELKKRIPTANVFYRRDWSLGMLLRYACQIRKTGTEVINIQYPTVGYGHSIVPHLLSLIAGSARKVVTLHEFSRGSFAGRLAMCLFFLTADRVVFTTDFERRTACDFAPWVEKKSVVIPIGSNIPFESALSRDIDVAYFGQICPTKGLEEFALAIQAVNQDRLLKVRVIGQIVKGNEEYASSICSQLENLGAEIVLGRTATEVASLLSRVRVALLPFPDGMSLRRGSAFAVMGNGALLLTTKSVCDAEILEGRCLMAEHTAELSQMLEMALSGYPSYDSVRIAGKVFAQLTSWDRITSLYLELIDGI